MAWIPDDNIASSRRAAQTFWQTPAGGYGDGIGGGLAAALSGLGYGLMNTDASNATQSNQTMRSDLMKSAASAPDNMSMGKLLMAGGVPDLEGQGMSTIAGARDKAASFGQQRSMADLAHQRAIELQNLQNKNAMALRQDTDIVRNLRAAGIDPNSDEGRGIIRNSIKGGSPVDLAVAGILNGMGQTASPGVPPPSSAQPRVQQQSNAVEPESDPNFVQAQTAPMNAPEGVTVQKPNDPMVNTPLGQMPQSKAKMLGFALALQGKGEAGKMIAGEGGAIGKEGSNEIDKQLIARFMDLGELNDIKGRFDKSYLSLEGLVKSTGMNLADWATGGAVFEPSAKDTPESAAKKVQAREWFKGYNEFTSAAYERLNNRIKAMSGTAVSGAEETRMLRATPDPSKDSPARFEDKMNSAIEMQRMAIARYNFLKSKYSEEQISALAKTGRIEGIVGLGEMRSFINKRGDALKNNFIKQGMSEQDATRQTGLRLRKEFGGAI